MLGNLSFQKDGRTSLQEGKYMQRKKKIFEMIHLAHLDLTFKYF